MSVILDNHGAVANSAVTGNSRMENYCYMFHQLAEAESQRDESSGRHFEALQNLSAEMDGLIGETSVQSDIPAIYTYFGQFMNHDMSAPVGTPAFSRTALRQKDSHLFSQSVILNNPDLVSLVSSQRPPNVSWIIDNIKNQHLMPLTLDSLYGDGPADASEDIRLLFQADGALFKIGQTVTQSDLSDITKSPAFVFHHPDRNRDIPRGENQAKIADQRNDGNLILSQLHLALMLFHNNTAEVLRPHTAKAQLFTATRRVVTLHYQYCIVNDFLNRLAPGVKEKIKNPILNQKGQVPFEFTTSAFRFGHSMISSSYDFNSNFGKENKIKNEAKLFELFKFTSSANMNSVAELKGQLPDHWVIDWNRFLDSQRPPTNTADRIDTRVAAGMELLPGPSLPEIKIVGRLSSICARNLKRGYHRFIASGQKIGKALALEGMPILSNEDVCSAFESSSASVILRQNGLDGDTPAWAYFLCEAKLLGKGNKLGPVCAMIVANTIIGLLQLDDNSVLRVNGGTWTPKDSPLFKIGHTEISDISGLLQFAGVLN